MRASSLSNKEVIELLNRYFVPVYARNGDYRDDGPASQAERSERQRIHRVFSQGGFSTGTVHAYVLSPDGEPIDSLHVADAAQPEKLIAMLRRVVESRRLEAGEPILEPAPQAPAPACEPGELVLHVTTRYLVREKDKLVPAPTDQLGRRGGWGALPSEEWLTYAADEVKRLLPPGPATPGLKWQIDPALTERFLKTFYPPAENNDLETNRIDEQRLTAEVIEVRDGVARARLEGTLRMKHAFYPGRPDDRFVDAKLAGYLDFDSASGRVVSLRVVTQEATYGTHSFGAALRNDPLTLPSPPRGEGEIVSLGKSALRRWSNGLCATCESEVIAAQ